MQRAQWLDLRGDYNVNAKNSIFVRYNYFRNTYPYNTNAGGLYVLDAASDFRDRARTAALLGFEGLQVNSYGAIASIDYLTESCAFIVTSMLSLGRLVQDLLLYSTAEFDYLRLSDGYVQISSIMPQKRNPVPLEHARILASRAMTGAQAILSSMHNTPFTDMNDSEDPVQALVDAAFADARRALLLLAGALSEATFNVEKMQKRAQGGFLPVTELADTLVRSAGITFHQAHAFVSKAVAECSGVFDRERIVASVTASLADAGVTPPQQAMLLEALDAVHFVRLRSIAGGPASAALDPEIARASQQLDDDCGWPRERRQKLSAASAQLRQAVDRMKASV